MAAATDGIDPTVRHTDVGSHSFARAKRDARAAKGPEGPSAIPLFAALTRRTPQAQVENVDRGLPGCQSKCFGSACARKDLAFGIAEFGLENGFGVDSIFLEGANNFPHGPR